MIRLELELLDVFTDVTTPEGSDEEDEEQEQEVDISIEIFIVLFTKMSSRLWPAHFHFRFWSYCRTQAQLSRQHWMVTSKAGHN